jgi:hypothetical protein
MSRRHEPDQEIGSNYRRKIMKYNMLVHNLKQTQGDALQYTTESAADELVKLPRSNVMELDEEVRQALVVRDTSLKAAQGASFHGVSLCMDQDDVARISNLFKDLARPMV